MAIGVDKKTKFYEGEMKYKLIMDFCNIYQETFFRVGEESTPNEEPKKPWMTEKFPEYTKESAGTLCFNVDGALCVLVIHKEKPNDKIQNIISSIQNWLSPKISRGIKYKFGWINSSTQNGMISMRQYAKKLLERDIINQSDVERLINNKSSTQI